MMGIIHLLYGVCVLCVVSLSDTPASWLCHISNLAEIIYYLGICKAQRRKFG